MTQAQAVAPEAARAPIELLLQQGGRYRDVVGLTDDDMEAIYNLAYTQYQQGQYREAERTFGVLCFHDHRSERFWLGLGAARQMMKSYQGAVLAYSMFAELGIPNPLAPLHAAECYLALGMYREALSGLETALSWAENHSNPAALVDRIEVICEALDKMVDLLPDD